MKHKDENKNQKENKILEKVIRIGLSFVIISIVILYIWAIIFGKIQDDNKLKITDLATIVLASIIILMILYPEFTDKIKTFSFGSLKFELKEVRKKQAEQESKLDDITLILPLLLPKSKQELLINLADHKTENYKWDHSIRSDLRELRNTKLIKSLPGTQIGELRENPQKDIYTLIALTDLGAQWVKRIKEINQPEVTNI